MKIMKMVILVTIACGILASRAKSQPCYGLTNVTCLTLTNGAPCTFKCPNDDGNHSATISECQFAGRTSQGVAGENRPFLR